MPRKRRRLESTKLPTKNWLNLPPEMRAMIIEERDQKTICQYSACSTLSREEIKRTNRFMNVVEVSGKESRPKLYIQHDSSFFDYDYDYGLEFIEVPDSFKDQTIVLYKVCKKFDFEKFDKQYFLDNYSKDSFAKWSEIVDGKPIDVIIKYLKEHIRKYARNITSFQLTDDLSITLDQIDLKLLKNLEKLDVGRYEWNFWDALNVDQIYNLKELRGYRTHFTFDQFIQSNLHTGTIALSEFNEDLLTKYMNLLKTSNVHENLSGLLIFVQNSFNLPTDEYLENLSKTWDIIHIRPNDEQLVIFFETPWDGVVVVLKKDVVLKRNVVVIYRDMTKDQISKCMLE